MSTVYSPTPESGYFSNITNFLSYLYKVLDYLFDIFDDYLDDLLDLSIHYLNYLSFAVIFLEYGSKFFNLRFNTVYSFIINVIIQSLICISLLVKFNPFHPKIKISELDKKLIFSAALYLVINLFRYTYTYISAAQARQRERNLKKKLEEGKNKKKELEKEKKKKELEKEKNKKN